MKVNKKTHIGSTWAKDMTRKSIGFKQPIHMKRNAH